MYLSFELSLPSFIWKIVSQLFIFWFHDLTNKPQNIAKFIGLPWCSISMICFGIFTQIKWHQFKTNMWSLRLSNDNYKIFHFIKSVRSLFFCFQHIPLVPWHRINEMFCIFHRNRHAHFVFDNTQFIVVDPFGYQMFFASVSSDTFIFYVSIQPSNGYLFHLKWIKHKWEPIFFWLLVSFVICYRNMTSSKMGDSCFRRKMIINDMGHTKVHLIVQMTLLSDFSWLNLVKKISIAFPLMKLSK